MEFGKKSINKNVFEECTSSGNEKSKTDKRTLVNIDYQLKPHEKLLVDK